MNKILKNGSIFVIFLIIFTTGVSIFASPGQFNLPLAWILGPNGESVDKDNSGVIDNSERLGGLTSADILSATGTSSGGNSGNTGSSSGGGGAFTLVGGPDNLPTCPRGHTSAMEGYWQCPVMTKISEGGVIDNMQSRNYKLNARILESSNIPVGNCFCALEPEMGSISSIIRRIATANPNIRPEVNDIVGWRSSSYSEVSYSTGSLGSLDNVEYESPNRCSVCVSDPTPNSRVFVTSTTYTGDLGGEKGADLKCQERADSAGLEGTFKAVLHGEIHSTIRDKFEDRPYENMKGEIIKEFPYLTDRQFLTANLESYYFYDEYERELNTKPKNDPFGRKESPTAWTLQSRSGASKEFVNSSRNCFGWTNDVVPERTVVDEVYVVFNEVDADGRIILNQQKSYCDEAHRLICIET